MVGLAGRTWPWEYLPGTSITILLELLPSLSTISLLVPTFHHCASPPLPRSHPALTNNVGEECLPSLLNETTARIPIVFRTSGLPMQGFRGIAAPWTILKKLLTKLEINQRKTKPSPLLADPWCTASPLKGYTEDGRELRGSVSPSEERRRSYWKGASHQSYTGLLASFLSTSSLREMGV